MHTMWVNWRNASRLELRICFYCFQSFSILRRCSRYWFFKGETKMIAAAILEAASSNFIINASSRSKRGNSLFSVCAKKIFLKIWNRGGKQFFTEKKTSNARTEEKSQKTFLTLIKLSSQDQHSDDAKWFSFVFFLLSFLRQMHTYTIKNSKKMKLRTSWGYLRFSKNHY